jgi:hypothetical protein
VPGVSCGGGGACGVDAVGGVVGGAVAVGAADESGVVGAFVVSGVQPAERASAHAALIEVARIVFFIVWSFTLPPRTFE